jgi:hypothetical protein
MRGSYGTKKIIIIIIIIIMFALRQKYIIVLPAKKSQDFTIVTGYDYHLSAKSTTCNIMVTKVSFS